MPWRQSRRGGVVWGSNDQAYHDIDIVHVFQYNLQFAIVIAMHMAVEKRVHCE